MNCVSELSLLNTIELTFWLVDVWVELLTAESEAEEDGRLHPASINDPPKTRLNNNLKRLFNIEIHLT